MSALDRYRKGAPRIPDVTCPIIDDAILALEEVEAIITKITSRHGQLEELRKANGALRDSSWYWRNSTEELANELDKLQDEYDNLLFEHEKLKEQLQLLSMQQVA